MNGKISSTTGCHKRASRHDIIVVKGDFNLKVGEENKGVEKHLGNMDKEIQTKMERWN